MLSGKPADVSPQSPGVTSQGKLSQGRTLGWRAADQSYSWGWPAWAGASQRGVGGPGKPGGVGRLEQARGELGVQGTWGESGGSSEVLCDPSGHPAFSDDEASQPQTGL